MYIGSGDIKIGDHKGTFWLQEGVRLGNLWAIDFTWSTNKSALVCDFDFGRNPCFEYILSSVAVEPLCATFKDGEIIYLSGKKIHWWDIQTDIHFFMRQTHYRRAGNSSLSSFLTQS